MEDIKNNILNEKEQYPELAEKIDKYRIGFSWIEKQNQFQLDEKFYQLKRKNS
ncbi:MAG: hypothetical protein HeimC3_25180 [Candidatus Heimdallarchaeota archaeon LC_3]|nr:MAG: hypothetical protein HeimC3_25180 [Candidatus Heimdallarchaeota archaeon LC_3]